MPSDPGSVRRWLNDIRYHIVFAWNFAQGISHEAFCDDLRTQVDRAGTSEAGARAKSNGVNLCREAKATQHQRCEALKRYAGELVREIARRDNVHDGTISRLNS
jgi:hypothetical protein